MPKSLPPSIRRQIIEFDPFAVDRAADTDGTKADELRVADAEQSDQAAPHGGRLRDALDHVVITRANMRTLVTPAFDSLSLREIGVARCDKFIKQLAKLSCSRAKQARVVLRLALELAVRHEVLPRNSMDHVARLHREPHVPDALTAPEVNVIRAAIAQWESAT